MPRSLWTGSLSFGLVNVPVQLVTGVRDLDLHFRQLHEKDGAPIEQQRWCSEEKKEVPWEEITHAYELDSGEHVIVTDAELEAVEPRKTRTIEIERFVDLEQVDPIYFDHPYFLLPAVDSEGAVRAYRLLVEVMERAERAALGRFVMRTKEYLALVRSRDERLTLTTLRFHDEIRPTTGIDNAGGKKAKPAKKELDQALAVIEALSSDWDPERYEDHYRSRLQAVVRKKRKGETVKAPKAEEPKGVPDLMEALERTLEEISSRGDGGKKKSRAKPKSKRGGAKKRAKTKA